MDFGRVSETSNHRTIPVTQLFFYFFYINVCYRSIPNSVCTVYFRGFSLVKYCFRHFIGTYNDPSESAKGANSDEMFIKNIINKYKYIFLNIIVSEFQISVATELLPPMSMSTAALLRYYHRGTTY